MRRHARGGTAARNAGRAAGSCRTRRGGARAEAGAVDAWASSRARRCVQPPALRPLRLAQRLVERMGRVRARRDPRPPDRRSRHRRRPGLFARPTRCRGARRRTGGRRHPHRRLSADASDRNDDCNAAAVHVRKRRPPSGGRAARAAAAARGGTARDGAGQRRVRRGRRGLRRAARRVPRPDRGRRQAPGALAPALDLPRTRRGCLAERGVLARARVPRLHLRVPRRRSRGRSRDRAYRRAALPRGSRRRPRDQPAKRRRPDRGRGGDGARLRALRACRLRGRRQPHRRLRAVPDPDRGRGARDRADRRRVRRGCRALFGARDRRASGGRSRAGRRERAGGRTGAAPQRPAVHPRARVGGLGMPRVTGERMLAGPPERVWALITNASELARAMPGAGEVKPEDGRSFRTPISLAVGPVKDTYEGRLAYEDEQPPTACTIVVETKGKSGHVAGRGAMRLEPREGEGTLVCYEGEFKVSGPVAGVGQRMIAGVARKTIERTLDGIGRRPTEAPEVTSERPAAAPTTAYWHPFANMAKVAGEELVIVRGRGCELVDREGRTYLDATAALWYCNVGYGRDEIAAAVEHQLRELHAYSTFGSYVNEPALKLAERVARLAPFEDGKVFFTSGGSDAVDTAAKLAGRYW